MPYFPGLGNSGGAAKPPNALGIAGLAAGPGAPSTMGPRVDPSIWGTGAQFNNPMTGAPMDGMDPATGYAMGDGTQPASTPAAPALPSWMTLDANGVPQDQALARSYGWTPTPGMVPAATEPAMDAPRYGPVGMQAPGMNLPEGMGGRMMFSSAPGAGGTSRFLKDIYDPSMGKDQADAAYKQATEYFDTDFGREDSALETKLANQGFAVGSEGYNNELERLRRSHSMARSNAALGAVGVGNQHALGIAGLALGARGQDTSETTARYVSDATGASAAAGRDASMSNAELQAQVAMRGLGLSENSQSFQQLMALISGARGGVPNMNFGNPAPLDVSGAYGINQSAANANGAARAANNAGLYNLGATLVGSYFGR